jgi:hypothetical protein
MNKIIYVGLAFALAFLTICCDDNDKVLDEAELPQTARNFIELHFPQQTIKHTTRDEDDYQVTLDNGFSLEFNLDGSWDEVSGNGGDIPASVIEGLPVSLSGYLSANYPSVPVIRLEIDRGNYDVELANYLELIFDIDGNFVRLDD